VLVASRGGRVTSQTDGCTESKSQCDAYRQAGRGSNGGAQRDTQPDEASSRSHVIPHAYALSISDTDSLREARQLGKKSRGFPHSWPHTNA
jgi:hypothetical protein